MSVIRAASPHGLPAHQHRLVAIAFLEARSFPRTTAPPTSCACVRIRSCCTRPRGLSVSAETPGLSRS